MPLLTRRRYAKARDKCWHIYYGEVHAGTLAMRSGNPQGTIRGDCAAAFIRDCSNGTSASFEQARVDFEAAWQVFLAKRIEADFQAGASSAIRKYALSTRGKL